MPTFLLDDIAAHIATLSPLPNLRGVNLVLGTNLFLSTLEDEPADQVAVYETPGLPADETMTQTLFAIENPRIQIAARAAEIPGHAVQPSAYVTARTCADKLYRELQKVANQTVNTTWYLRIVPVQPPYLLYRDENHRPVVGFTCDVSRDPA